MTTLAKILGETYSLCRHDGSVVAPTVYLLPEGRIIGCDSLNETAWSFADGVLYFHDETGTATTRFTAFADADGVPTITGDFLPHPGIRHILRARRGTVHGRLMGTTPQPARPLLIMVRAHLVNDKLHRLLDQLRDVNTSADLAVIYDRTHGMPQADFTDDVIWHSIAECKDIGLTQHHEQLLWWCGDFPFYFALKQRPSYEYYAMVEYDVHFTGDAGAFVGRLQAALSKRAGSIDAVGTRLREEDRNPNGLHGPIVRQFNPAYSYFFPLIVLSRRAAAFLYTARRLEAALGIRGDAIAYCESFVASYLAANGFVCADLNELLPGSYDNDLMVLGNIGGLPASLADRFRDRVELVHPVYGDEQYLTGRISRIGVSELQRFIRLLDRDPHLAGGDDLRERCRQLAAARLAQLS